MISLFKNCETKNCEKSMPGVRYEISVDYKIYVCFGKSKVQGTAIRDFSCEIFVKTEKIL